MSEIIQGQGAPTLRGGGDDRGLDFGLSGRESTRSAGAEGAASVTVRLDGRASEFSLRPDDVPVLEAAMRVR